MRRSSAPFFHTKARTDASDMSRGSGLSLQSSSSALVAQNRTSFHFGGDLRRAGEATARFQGGPAAVWGA